MLILVPAFLLALWICIMVHTTFSPAFHPSKDLLCSLVPGKFPVPFCWQLGVGAGGFWALSTPTPPDTSTGPVALGVPQHPSLQDPCWHAGLQGSSNQPGLWPVKGIWSLADRSCCRKGAGETGMGSMTLPDCHSKPWKLHKTMTQFLC